jgi:hypothetical protein
MNDQKSWEWLHSIAGIQSHPTPARSGSHFSPASRGSESGLTHQTYPVPLPSSSANLKLVSRISQCHLRMDVAEDLGHLIVGFSIE